MPRLRFLPCADKYFAKSYLVFLLLCVGGLLVLVIVGDVYQKAEDFTAYQEESERGIWVVLKMMLEYYLTFSPRLILEWMLPLVVLLAATITVTAASTYNEYTVLRASGISVQRALLPILVLAFLVGYVAESVRDAYLPFLIRRSYEISTTVRGKQTKRPIAIVLRDGDTVKSIAMGHFEFKDTYIAHNLWIETRTAANAQRAPETFRVYTARAAYLQPRTDPDRDASDPRQLQWKPIGRAVQIENSFFVRGVTTPWEEPLPTLVTPAMLERKVLGDGVMKWEELERLAPHELDVRLEMQRRRSEPWACLVVTMLGISLIMRQVVRGAEPNYVKNVIIAILVCLGFYTLREAFTSLGEAGLPPVLAAWLPVLIVGAAGIWFYRNLER